jgi:hypothetical protein
MEVLMTRARRAALTACVFISGAALGGSAVAQEVSNAASTQPAARPNDTHQAGTPDSQQQPVGSGWQFYVTPYIWLSGLGGSIGTQNPNAPTHPVTASFGELLSHLNNVPLMGSFEARNGRFGLMADIMFISLKTPVSTRGPLFSGVTARSAQLVSTELGTYRVLDLQNQWLDVGGGVRTISVWTKLTFNPGLAPGFTQSASPSWANPIFAMRYHLDLPDKFGLTVYGDVGGVSNLTWQVIGTVEYRYSDNITFETGYRHLHINWNGDVMRMSLALGGPFLGVTFRFR